MRTQVFVVFVKCRVACDTAGPVVLQITRQQRGSCPASGVSVKDPMMKQISLEQASQVEKFLNSTNDALRG